MVCVLHQGRKESDWDKLFEMVVWVHNSSTHRLSQLPSHVLICAPEEMTKDVEKSLQQKEHDYVYMRPYYSIEDMCEYTPLVFGNDEK